RTPGARWKETRHPRPTLQGGLPGTADDEAIFVPVVLSRGRRRNWRRHLAAPGSYVSGASRQHPLVELRCEDYRTARGGGDKVSRIVSPMKRAPQCDARR